MPLLSFYLWSLSSQLVCFLVLNLSLFSFLPFRFAFYFGFVVVIISNYICVSALVLRGRYAIDSCCQRRTPLISSCACCGKTCNLDDRCEEFHDWPDDRCKRVSGYVIKLPLQQKKKRERKAKTSSSSFSAFCFNACTPVSAAFACCYRCRYHHPFIYSVCGDFLGRYSGCAACGCYSSGAGLQAVSCGIAEEVR